ncbi:hypothetical protein EVAR_70740_1 [Eumeta japonica]|uniref:Uncharacterized protein n=1 Tax=Eumeta variegata TaxID=151549 RepID=A0A4C2ABI0_EUMVA|nr:hypothetical protein EVAR_70740_1 [Eumeta japonica]
MAERRGAPRPRPGHGNHDRPGTHKSCPGRTTKGLPLKCHSVIFRNETQKCRREPRPRRNRRDGNDANAFIVKFANTAPCGSRRGPRKCQTADAPRNCSYFHGFRIKIKGAGGEDSPYHLCMPFSDETCAAAARGSFIISFYAFMSLRLLLCTAAENEFSCLDGSPSRILVTEANFECSTPGVPGRAGRRAAPLHWTRFKTDDRWSAGTEIAT